MLIEFSVSNFRSIKEMQTLSFVATAMSEHEDTHVFQANEKTRLLKSVGVYGANGSGKSNLIKALMAMLNFIKYSFKDEEFGAKVMETFMLDDEYLDKDIFFQIIFINDGKKYRYGFTYRNNKINSEWLFADIRKNEVKLFTRTNKYVDLNESSFKDLKKVNIKNLEKDVIENNLLINLYAKFGGTISKSIKKYLEDNYIISLGVADSRFARSSYEYLKDDKTKNDILQFINKADVGIKNILIEEEPVENDLKEILKNINKRNDSKKVIDIVKIKVSSIRQKNNSDQNIEFDFEENESEGTKRLLNFSGVIIDSINNSKILFLDEFDARLHPIITREIIKLFNSKENKSAQLCFITHDTNLLDKDLLRRDQIYFVEKNSKAETSIYSLAEIKAVRNDASFEKDYIKGKYGAIPFVKNLNSIF
ncbi:MAG: ATP-binding protein [Arcicella sp.]|nr:ATP-binding protein [Arcicella sp.]